MSAKKRQVSTKRFIEYSNSSSPDDGAWLDTAHSTPERQKNDDALLEPCLCFPLSTHCLTTFTQSGEINEQDTLFLNDEHLVQATPQLNYALRTRLREYFPRTGPLSLLVLHVSQLDQPALTSSIEPVYQKRRYHVTQNILAQVLSNVQRAVRLRDQLLIEEGVGAALLFPSVDEQGIQNIVERVYRSICLLQAETIVPPLLRVTDIVLGYGTCTTTTQNTPNAQNTSGIEQTIEALLASTGRVARRLLLRPALATSLWETMPDKESPLASSLSTFDESQEVSLASAERAENESDEQEMSQEQYSHMHNNLTPYTPPAIRKQSARRRESGASPVTTTSIHDTLPVSSVQTLSSDATTLSAPTIPFLHLPTTLAPRLKHLIPYTIARELQCAPVGRDHHRLTVAMANPTDHEAIQRLSEVTGMTIFPVSCEVEALLTLLSERW